MAGLAPNVTSDPDFFFRSDEHQRLALERAQAAKNTLGNPVRLLAKVLDMCIVPNVIDTPAKILVADAGSICSALEIKYDPSIQKDTRFIVCKRFKGHKGPVSAVLCHINDTKLNVFTGGWDGTVRIFDFSSETCLYTIMPHSDYVKCMLLLPNESGLTLLTGSFDKSVAAIKIKSNGEPNYPLIGSFASISPEYEFHRFKEHRRGVECIELGNWPLFYTASSDSTICVYNIETKSFVQSIQGHLTNVTDLKFSDDLLFSSSIDGTIRITMENGSQQINVNEPIRCILLLNNDYLLAGCRDGTIRVYNLADQKMVNSISGHYDEVCKMIFLSPQLILSAGLDCTLRFWNAKDLIDPNLKEPVDQFVLTEEEEREIRELMDE